MVLESFASAGRTKVSRFRITTKVRAELASFLKQVHLRSKSIDH